MKDLNSLKQQKSNGLTLQVPSAYRAEIVKINMVADPSSITRYEENILARVCENMVQFSR